MEDKIKEFLKEKFGDAVIAELEFRGQLSIVIGRDYLFDICAALKNNNELNFAFLLDICAIDWLGQAEETDGRFEVFYNLYSLKNKSRLFLRVRLSGDDPEIDSLTSLWQSANWLEREVYDLFGVEFTGHPNLIKIVTPDELKGHPLRKDYPLTYEIPQFSHNKNEPPEVIQ
ncbi:MAG: NADH-quinone oxidoreductase subunit C [Candidatus Zixiibacteriota bacterium]|nr:MAG: NADH-quinone oxidoreductase subunit C [candidate division Zixibacteria bacterium]